EHAPRLPVIVMLEHEVDELADAHVYLDPQNDEAPLALDLLLGTQGWRRFAFIRSGDFLAEHGDAARRVLAMRTVTHDEMTRLGMRWQKQNQPGIAMDEASGVVLMEGNFIDAPAAPGEIARPAAANGRA